MTVPGDKSISHRSLIFGALAVGETRITGLLEGEDVLATAESMRRLGARVTRHEDGSWSVSGVGVGGLVQAWLPVSYGEGSGVWSRLARHDLLPFAVEAEPARGQRPRDRVGIEGRVEGGGGLARADDDRVGASMHG